jgi:2-polyprenyl-3-methyl-5-hydroxy-6-metoxy-1,4-benzoquinol methylase
MEKQLNIISRASNPKQYDLDDVAWEADIGLESPVRVFIWDYLKKFSTDWKGRSVLDIGAGSGWLLEEARKLGAVRADGVEPSQKNFEASKKLFPKIRMFNSSLAEFVAGQEYDFVISVLALSHILDIEKAFQKISGMIKKGGEFIIVMLDYNYYKSSRFDYEIQMEDIDANTYAIYIRGKYGALADVVRKTELYPKIAEKVGLKHIETIPMKPSSSLISGMPQFNEVKDKVIFNLIHFIKL